MELFKTAWKNIFRNPRRSILNIIALTIGMVMIIFFLGWMRGYNTNIFQSMIRFETGHIQILNADYLSERRRSPLDLTIRNYAKLRQELLSDPKISEISGRLDFEVTLKYKNNSVGLRGRAIDPLPEAGVTTIRKHIVSGNYLQNGVLIGQSLADKLQLKAGDTVLIKVLNRYSHENEDYYLIDGIFNFAYPEIDDNLIYMNLKTAGTLLGTGMDITRAVIRLAPQTSLSTEMRTLQDKLAGTGLRVYPWQRFAEVVVSAVKQDGDTFSLMLVICYALIVIGIINSMSMSIHDREREISTLRAIGMKRRQLVLLLLYETLCIVLIAGVCSLLISLPLAAFLQFIGFDMKGVMPENIPIPFGERFTADFRWYDFAIGILIGTSAVILGTIRPANRAARNSIAATLGGGV